MDAPRLDAELLLEAASGISRADLAARPELTIEPGAARAFGELVRRRIRREPLAYIVGRRHFRRLEVEVDPRVLIPRPETELLVEVAVELRPRTVLDVGTGSGAVALAVADELAEARVTATDTSAAALGVAAGNAARLGLEERVSFATGAVPSPPRRFDLVLANLPYVRDDEWERLQPEITRYEPREALVAGTDGLDAIRALLSEPPDCEAIALEVGAGQAEAVEDLVRAAGFGDVGTRPDLAGTPRVVIGR